MNTRQGWLFKDERVTVVRDLSLPVCECKSPPWEDCEHTEPVLDDCQAEHLIAIMMETK